MCGLMSCQTFPAAKEDFHEHLQRDASSPTFALPRSCCGWKRTDKIPRWAREAVTDGSLIPEGGTLRYFERTREVSVETSTQVFSTAKWQNCVCILDRCEAAGRGNVPLEEQEIPLRSLCLQNLHFCPVPLLQSGG